MNGIKLASSVAVGLLAVLALPRDAHALGPVGVEVGARAGVGTNPGDGSPNPLGFGIGARGGVEILNIYGGVSLMYYLGGSNTVNSPVGNYDYSVHTLMYGVEGGYSFKLLEDMLTIRPQLGLGNATFSSSTSGNVLGASASGSGSSSNLYLEPGVVGLVSLAGWFVGGDINYLVLPGAGKNSDGSSKTLTGATIHGQVGLKF